MIEMNQSTSFNTQSSSLHARTNFRLVLQSTTVQTFLYNWHYLCCVLVVLTASGMSGAATVERIMNKQNYK